MTDLDCENVVSQFVDAAKKSFLRAEEDRWFGLSCTSIILARLMVKLRDADVTVRSRAISSLITHGVPEVRLWAAVIGLANDASASVAVLRQLGTRADLVSLAARLWLERWQSGEYENAMAELFSASASSEENPGIPRNPDNGPLLRPSVPREMAFDNIPDPGRLDDRISAANVICPFTIGVNTESISWVPDHEPPSNDEEMVWLWVIRPDFGERIMRETRNRLLIKIIGDYNHLMK